MDKRYLNEKSRHKEDREEKEITFVGTKGLRPVELILAKPTGHKRQQR